MAIAAYQATGTASSVASGVPTPTLPTHLANDLAVLSITCDPTFDASVSTPSGWFLIGAVNNPSVATRISVFGRWLATASDPNPTIQSFTNFAYAVITTYRGADPSQTLTVVGTQGNNNSANATFNPNLVTDFSEELLVFIVGWGNDSVGPLGGTITNAALLSPATRYNLGTTDGSGGGIVVCDGQLPVAIRVGTLTVQMTTASANATVAFALRSATSVASSPVPVVGNAGTSVTTAVVDTQVLFSGTATAGSTAILQIGTPNGVAGDLVAGLEQGFTLLGYAEGTGATNPSRVTLWVKHNIVGAGGDTGPTVKSNSDHFTASIRTYSGVVSVGDPIDVVGYSNPTISSTTGTWPDVTTTVPGCLILNYGSDGADQIGNTWTVPANAGLYYVTEAGEVRTTTGHGGGVVLITGAQATAGATGATTSTVTNSSGGRITVALKPSFAPIVGALTVTTGDATLSATADLLIDATLTATLDAATLDSDATVESPPVPTAFASTGGTQYVIAIQGYGKLLTDGDADLALDAWQGEPETEWDTDEPYWTDAIGGCQIDLQIESAIDPWNPVVGGGRLTVHVFDDGFGIDTHRTAGGADTRLVTELDRDDIAEVEVQSTAAFAGADAVVWIGNEAIAYDGTSGDTFDGPLLRGFYPPFFTADGDRFSLHHRVGAIDFGIALQPVVSQYPRDWKGRWVGVWQHHVVDGALCPKSQAKLVYAGTWGAHQDDPRPATVVQFDHILDRVRNVTVGRDMWRGRVADGVYLEAGARIYIRDKNDAGAQKEAILEVTLAPPVDTSELEEGWYGADDIVAALNAFAADQLTAGLLWGTYTFSIQQPDDSTEWRLMCDWQIPMALTGVPRPRWQLEFTQPWTAIFMGMEDNETGWIEDDADEVHRWTAENSPFRVMLTRPGGATIRIALEDEVGTFQDQTDLMPASIPGGKNGLFLVDGLLLAGFYTGFSEINGVQQVTQLSGSQFLTGQIDVRYGRLYGDTTPIDVAQVLHYFGQAAAVTKALFYSTGTAGFNHADFDVLGYGYGAAIPGSLLGAVFEESLDALPGAENDIMVIIDRPRKLYDLTAVEFLLRRAHLIFHDGHLRFTSWSTPIADLAIHDLTEETKAEPAANIVDHRSVSMVTDEWQAPIVKIEYNRSLRDATFRNSITIEDATAVDAADGAVDIKTLSALNTFGEISSSGAGIEELAPGYLAWFPYWSRAVSYQVRSLAKPYWLTIAPGDIVNVGDLFARDPFTGERGTTRPGLVMSVKWSPGFGGEDGAPMSGEIRVAFLAVDRMGTYVPTAEVDSSVTGGGFDAGYNNTTKTLRTLPHEHSESGVAVDASRFHVDDRVLIVEIDPEDPSTALWWSKRVSAVSGNDITLNDVLDDFDNTKQYRVIYQDYSQATPTQKSHVFQADDADGRILDVAVPYQLGDVFQYNLDYTHWDHTDTPERHAALAIGDGAGLDTGHDRALAKTVNNVIDHKRAVQSPSVDDTVLSVPTGHGAWTLTHYQDRYIGTERQNIAVTRNVSIAPEFCSKTGATATCRVYVSREPLSTPNIHNVTISGPNVDVHTFTTTSTTLVVPTPHEFSAALADEYSGLIYVIVECDAQCKVTGIGYLEVLEREN